MKNSKLQIFKFLFASLTLCLPLNAFSQTLAPGAPGKDAQWSTAGKQAIGTSFNTESKVWFTLAEGALTEVYYPDVTVANVHKLEFVVVNPKTKKVETETEDAKSSVFTNDSFQKMPQFLKRMFEESWTEIPFSKNLSDVEALDFKQVSWAKNDKWWILKTYITDPQSNTLMMRVRFMPKDKDLQLYVYYDPSLGNTGMHDTAWNQGQTLLAQDKDISSALVSSESLTEISNGFYQTSDGLEQLKANGKIITPFERAENGNVTQIAKVNYTARKEMTFALGFGKSPDEAMQIAQNSLKKGFDKCDYQYVKGWSDYVKTLPKVDEKYQAQFNMAAMVLKAQEDKTVRGANVASLTIPWGGGANANEDVGGGYHLVWSRDLYQVVTAYMALGDLAAANRALDFLFNIQQKPDGSFPQNSWLDGRCGWCSLQLDEIAYPLIIAYQLKRFDKATYENHVKKAADFLVKTGPKTTQERWEEKPGYSPSTIAAEIAGLVCAADIAKRNGDDVSANLYLKTADDWQSNIEKWTATTNGKFGDGNYYVRLTANGKPDAGEKIELSNSSGAFFENEIVDAGFLELVRLGIKSPDDPLIQKSVKVVDEVLKVNTPNGESFYRYNHDGYGEMDDGRRWNWDGKYTGKGRLWALLAGERGQYELALCEKQNSDFKKKNPDDERYKDKQLACGMYAALRLENMVKFANDGLMIPEQIWDKADVPKNMDKQFVPNLKFGEGTGSATPLAWSMAQFIRLAVNLQAGKNLDTPDIVYNRYVLGKKQSIVNIYPIQPSPQPAPTVTDNFIKDEPKTNTNMEVLDKLPQGKVFSETFRSTPISPKTEGENAAFTYEHDGKDIEIVGDFTGWKSRGLKFSSNRKITLQFKKDARVEYKLIVDGKWILDPLNPNKVDNGVGGENSFFTMLDYKPTV